jgi:hypothetical protein
MGATTCDACGATDDELVEVHRLYVTPEAWDREAKTVRVETTEQWCFPCRTHYPHETATD